MNTLPVLTVVIRRLHALRPRNFPFALAALVTLIAPMRMRATLPPVPQGVAVLNTIGDKALRDGILGNPDVAMISIAADWSDLQPDEATFDPSYLDNPIGKITAHPDKSIFLRLKTMGGAHSHGGQTPDWVFEAMGLDDPLSQIATPGTTYSFTDSDSILRCIPVFWEPVYLAKKRALIAIAGAHFAANPAIKIVGVSYAGAISDDWNIPNNPDGSPSEVELWLNAPEDKVPGAAYKTEKMIDAAIHQADASFIDGVITGDDRRLNSASAAFTQADLGHEVTWAGDRAHAFIAKWNSPTQVVLNKRITPRHPGNFTILARRDGLIDVAMAAFPNQYIAGAVNGNGPDLDTECTTDGDDVGICLPQTVDEMAQALYPGRYIVQRNNVQATIPKAEEADGSAWVLLIKAAAAGMPTAGQALGVCWSNTDTPSYRMNSKNNCDHDIPDCDLAGENCEGNCCEGDCALSLGDILLRSAQRIAGYSARYYEIYPPDASNLKEVVTEIRDLLDPLGEGRNRGHDRRH